MILHSERGLLHVVRLGTTPFRRCWDLQRRLLDLRSDGAIPDTLLLTEHEPVYTLGRTGDPNHMLAPPDRLRAQQIEFLPIERGGDITYHGPGQLVGYPILNLLESHPDLHWYVRALEETIMRLLDHYGIRGSRHEKYTGVWVGENKICAIGIHTRGWVTMHGFALNVDTDLAAFDEIVPCGIRGKGVTSMSRELGRPVDPSHVEALCIEEFCSVLHYSPRLVPPESLPGYVSGNPDPASPLVKESG